MLMHNEYYNLEDILSSHQKAPCIFQQVNYGLGYLTQSRNTAFMDISAGYEMELPLWLIEVLVNRDIIVCNVPICYDNTSQNEMKADAWNVNLNELNLYYYRYGRQLAPYLSMSDEAEKLVQYLAEIWVRRVKRIWTDCFNACHEDGLEGRLRKLDVSERDLYRLGHTSAIEYQLWKDRKSHSFMTQSHHLNHLINKSNNKRPKVD